MNKKNIISIIINSIALVITLIIAGFGDVDFGFGDVDFGFGLRPIIYCISALILIILILQIYLMKNKIKFHDTNKYINYLIYTNSSLIAVSIIDFIHNKLFTLKSSFFNIGYYPSFLVAASVFYIIIYIIFIILFLVLKKKKVKVIKND